jgi:putative FmdB family regulatory protein
MPLYEYSCPNCQSQFELLIRGSEQPECPQCHSTNVEKLLSVPAAHTHGSRDLPLCEPRGSDGTCGLPQCGMGGCMFS